MKQTMYRRIVGLAFSLGLVSMGGMSHAQSFSDFLDVLGDTVPALRDFADMARNAFEEASDPLDDPPEGYEDEGRRKPFSRPSDPLDDPPEGYEDDGRKRPFNRPSDPLDDPPEGYEDDGRKRPFNRPSDPLDDSPDLGEEDLPPSPEFERLLDEMRDQVSKYLAQADDAAREELEKLRQKHLEEVQAIKDEYRASVDSIQRYGRKVCRRFALSQARRAKLYKTRQAEESYYWDVLSLLNDRNMFKSTLAYQQQVVFKKSDAQIKQAVEAMMDMQREKERLTLEQYRMNKRHILERAAWAKADAKDDLSCSQAECRESRSSCPDLGFKHQERLRDIDARTKYELEIMNKSIEQYQDVMEEAERDRQNSLNETKKQDRLGDMTPEEKQALQQLMQKAPSIQGKSGQKPPQVIRGNGRKGSSFKPSGTHFKTGYE